MTQRAEGHELLDLAAVAVAGALRGPAPAGRPPVASLADLLEATLLVVTPAAPASSHRVLATTGNALQWTVVTDEDGPVLPLFTSTDALEHLYRQDVPHLSLPARLLTQLAAANGVGAIVLDPGSPSHATLGRHDIEALAAGRVPGT